MTSPKAFRIEIPDDTIADLRSRLARSRFAELLPGHIADLGTSHERLQMIVRRWMSFDWRSAEVAINAVPAFRTEIDGMGIHFLHVTGEGRDNIPLLLTNGWPSCFLELMPLIPLLTRAVDGVSFDVVIPSLPGYGFSDAPTTPGLNITRIAALCSTLMKGLGYGRFLAHGSDMGAGVVERLRANHADQVEGIHMVNVNWFYPPPDDITLAEETYLRAAQFWRAREGAYAMLQASKPRSIAAALQDTPIGLAAWIVEKLDAWSDGDGITLDTICALLTIYWATSTIGSSMYLYHEAFADAGVMAPPPRRGAPVAVAVFPKDILPAPRAWAERWYELTRWTEMPRGGHFPGFECPDLLANDLRGFARDIGLTIGV